MTTFKVVLKFEITGENKFDEKGDLETFIRIHETDSTLQVNSSRIKIVAYEISEEN